MVSAKRENKSVPSPVGDSVEMKKEKAEERRHKLQRRAVIVGASIGALAGILAAYINYLKPSPSLPENPPTITSMPATTTATTNTNCCDPKDDEKRSPFNWAWHDYTLNGTMVWSKGDKNPRMSGAFLLPDESESARCSVRVGFRSFRAGDVSMQYQDRRCEKTEEWPLYGPVWFEGGREVVRVDVMIFLDGNEVAKYTCLRAADCKKV